MRSSASPRAVISPGSPGPGADQVDGHPATPERGQHVVGQRQRVVALGLLERDHAVAVGVRQHPPAAVADRCGVGRHRHRAAAGQRPRDGPLRRERRGARRVVGRRPRAPPRRPAPAARRCPGPTRAASRAGAIRNPISSPRPSRSRPAAARMTPSRPRSVRLRRRVSTLPRTGSICRSGRRRRSCDARRSEAVATRAPSGTSSQRAGRADPGVARIGPLQAGAERQARRLVAGQVLRGVHGDVDAAVAQRLLDLGREDAAAADLGERAPPVAVALRRERHDRDGVPEPAQRGRGKLRLRHREPGGAGADADRGRQLVPRSKSARTV